MRKWIALVIVVAWLVGFRCLSYAGDEPTPHSIIDRALKAGGGAEKIRDFKAVSFKADVMFNGKKSTIIGLFAGPTLFRLELKVEKEDAFSVIGGGDTVWVKSADGTIKEISNKVEFEAVLPIFHAMTLPDRLLSLKAKEYKLTIVGEQAVNGVQAVALRVKHELYPEALVYFDKETGFPVKSQVKSKIDRGFLFPKQAEEALELFFDDYKEFASVKHFTKLKLRAGDESIHFELRELKLHKKLDPGTFKKPG